MVPGKVGERVTTKMVTSEETAWMELMIVKY
jgi:hypothetical protein